VFDAAEEFGIDAKVLEAWDISTQLACAAGLLALRDAGIPLTPVEQVGKGGLRLIRSWEVPSAYRDRTGVIFSSCFSGHQMAAMHAKNQGADEEGRFDRRYLFQILTMGHSQFAQHVGIRGPNTTLNVACASATAAFGIAEDWLAADRCDRAIIISADDVTCEDLWEWIGSGFAASGAAATNNVIEDAAAPLAANPEPIHSHKSSHVTSSAEMIIALSQRSAASQSSAIPNAAVAEAQATLRVVLGPRIPTC
jgi:3-oxoacyl-(acyl-carrier-protein) synthase